MWYKRGAMTVPKSGLVRAIGRWSLVALTLNSVIGSGVFGLPGTIAGLLGSQATLAVVLAGVAVGVIILCFAEVASQFSEAGGPYLYARAVFGPLTGIVVGWTFYLSQTAAQAANANLFVSYLAEFWPGARGSRLLILAALVGFLAIINFFGVKQGARLSDIFTIAKMLPLLMVILAGAALLVFRTAPMNSDGPFAGSVWLQAFMLLVFAYGGFETALVPMGEAKDPKRDVVPALAITMVLCTVVYSLVQWVVVGVLGSGAQTDRPLAEVARLTMGGRGAALVALGALVSIYGYLSAKMLAMPRVTFALAASNDVPRVFAWLHRRFHTPWVSIFFYALVLFGLAIIGSFAWNVALSSVSRLFHYAVICVALIVLRRREPRSARFRLPGGQFFAVIGILICVAIATRVDLSQSRILAATVAAAVLNWGWVRLRMRQRAHLPVSASQ